jgi:hypothetical protein
MSIVIKWHKSMVSLYNSHSLLNFCGNLTYQVQVYLKKGLHPGNCLPFYYCVYHGENKLIFNEMMMRSALYKTNTLSCNFLVLAHWNNSPWVDMLLHSHTFSRFWANPSLLALLLLTAELCTCTIRSWPPRRPPINTMKPTLGLLLILLFLIC